MSREVAILTERTNQNLFISTYKVRAKADPGKSNVEVVGQVFNHVCVGLLLFGGANQTILPAKMSGNCIGFCQSQVSFKK